MKVIDLPDKPEPTDSTKEERDATIARINDEYALVIAGDKAVIMKFEDDKTFRLLQVGAFRQWFSNQWVTIERKPIRVGDYWLSHRRRHQYAGIEFEPSGKGRPGYYNIWQGFAVQRKKGDCSRFLAHVKDNVARGDQATFLWIIGWFAQIVQQRTVKMETSLVLRGPRGAGKTKIGQVIGSLFGNHYVLVANPRYITGQFNSHMASLLLLHADEAFWAGDRKSIGTLNDLVSGREHMIEFKKVDPIRVKNHVRLFVTGNPDWMIPAGFKERRWAVFDMGEDRMQDHEYFAAIDREMDKGGREALLDYLLDFNLKQVNLRSIPKTAALLDQQIESMDDEQAWWLDTLMSGALPPELLGVGKLTCTKEAIHRRYVRHAKLTGVSRKSTETKLGGFLTKHLGTELKVTKPRIGGEQIPCYIFPPLKDCRRLFSEKLGQAIDWGNTDDGKEEEWHHQPDEADRF